MEAKLKEEEKAREREVQRLRRQNQYNGNNTMAVRKPMVSTLIMRLMSFNTALIYFCE